MSEPGRYVVIAHHHVRSGAGDIVEAALRDHGAATQEEPGCAAFIAHRSIADPDSFAIYEAYHSQSDWHAHQHTPHYKKYVIDTIKPLLLSRELDFYRPVPAAEQKTP
ncbi:MAG: putative quinol monooxygenase [Mycobacterium sp.]